MRALICFTSKNGATERYMHWLAEDLQADIKTFNEVNRGYDFAGYDTVVVSSGTYMGSMKLTRFLKKHWPELKEKKIVAVAVGAAPVDDRSWSIRPYEKIPLEIRNIIRYIKIQGESPERNKPAGYQSPVRRENLDPVLSLLER